ncbi:hypothetical protein LINGRAPRIM_LOCUS1709 [Linum grandiflorum]
MPSDRFMYCSIPLRLPVMADPPLRSQCHHQNPLPQTLQRREEIANPYLRISIF